MSGRGQSHRCILSPCQFKEFSRMFDPETKRGTVHLQMDAMSKVGLYDLELVMMLNFSEDGKLVTKIIELFDSVGYQAFFAKVQAAQTQQQQS
jgi:hypothetical protein